MMRSSDEIVGEINNFLSYISLYHLENYDEVSLLKFIHILQTKIFQFILAVRVALAMTPAKNT